MRDEFRRKILDRRVLRVGALLSVIYKYPYEKSVVHQSIVAITACPVTTDLIMRVDVRTTATTTTWY